MPKHPYDGLCKLKDLLNEELRKRRHPGIYKIEIIGEAYKLCYSSYNGQKLSNEFARQLISCALFLFKSTDPRGYSDFVNLCQNVGEIRYLV